jgi:hypothetical protein
MNALNFALFAERRLACFFQNIRHRLVQPARSAQTTCAPTKTVSLCTRAPKPLRVLRVMEPGQQRASVGRMVISGRMADVCAELDRLAAGEAAMS